MSKNLDNLQTLKLLSLCINQIIDTYAKYKLSTPKNNIKSRMVEETMKRHTTAHNKRIARR